MSQKRERPKLSLVEFVRAKKRANCSVCKLSVEIRGQLGRTASEKKISREQQVEWIKMVSGVTITIDELNAHVNGRHDAP